MADKYSFEESLQRLDEISASLSSEAIELDQALELYAEASKLINFCNKKLTTTQAKIEKLMGSNGVPCDE